MDNSHRGDEFFANSGFANPMGWGKRPVLLIIDVCKAYWTKGSPLNLSAHQPSATVPVVIQNLLTAARTSGVPVIWTCVEYKTMTDAGLFWLKSKSLDVWQVSDTRGFGDWMEGLEPRDGESVIKKKYPSAFFGTTLATDLVVMGADTVVICGVSTSGCVRASTLDAMQNGFRPMASFLPFFLETRLTYLLQVVGTACGDRSEEIQNSNLFDLNAKYADIVTEADAINHLSRTWG